MSTGLFNNGTDAFGKFIGLFGSNSRNIDMAHDANYIPSSKTISAHKDPPKSFKTPVKSPAKGVNLTKVSDQELSFVGTKVHNNSSSKSKSVGKVTPIPNQRAEKTTRKSSRIKK